MASRLEDVILRGTRAAQPAANTLAAGTLYFVIAENVLERSNGTSWETYSGSGGSGGGSSNIGLALGLLLDGIDGERGEDSFIPGPQGIQGLTGATGASGSGISVIGPPGLDGDEPEFPYIIPGPAGATGPQGPAGSSGSISSVTVAVTNTEILSLNTAPKEIVPAPGANIAVIPLQLTIFKEGSAAGYSASVTVRLRPAGVSTDLMSVISFLIDTVARDTYHTKNMAEISELTTPTNFINKAIQLSLSADVTGGNAANYLRVGLAYYTLNVG